MSFFTQPAGQLACFCSHTSHCALTPLHAPRHDPHVCEHVSTHSDPGAFGSGAPPFTVVVLVLVLVVVLVLVPTPGNVRGAGAIGVSSIFGGGANAFVGAGAATCWS